jgi:Arylsulfotransferase (ASST)
MRYIASSALALALMTEPSRAQSRVDSSAAVILFSPLQSTFTYLMTLDGELVHSWQATASPGNSVYLLEDGSILRPATVPSSRFADGGGLGGRLERYDWDNHLLWSFEYAGPDHQQHHDVEPLPDGNVLFIAWETRSKAEALAAGRRGELLPPEGILWVDTILEVDPRTNDIVWTWRLWDHLLPPGADPAQHPELVDPSFDPNYASRGVKPDWTHANAVAYNADLDEILLSVRNLSEVWILDHGTTPQEAAGHAGGRRGRGGDLLYRWGNPAAYSREGERQLWGQHNARWIERGLPGAGHILLFDNGDQTARPYSTVVEIAPPLRSDGTYTLHPGSIFGPEEPQWQFEASPPEALFASFISGAERLAIGDTLICDGPEGRFLEVTPGGEIDWSYTVTTEEGATGVAVFRAERYEADHPGLVGRALAPLGPLRVRLDLSSSSTGIDSPEAPEQPPTIP